MIKSKTWYTLEKHHNVWTIWKNVEGGCGIGCFGIYSSINKRDCSKYIKQHNIKLGKR